MKDNSSSFLKIVLAYCLIIGTVLLWSGHDREKTVFDNYLISFKGLTLACDNIALSRLFLNEVLEFHSHKSQDDLFILPDQSSLRLIESKDPKQSNLEIHLRVRNGIYKLYDRLQFRVNKFHSTHNLGTISDSIKSDNTISFFILDPSGIKITFYQDRVFSKGL